MQPVMNSEELYQEAMRQDSKGEYQKSISIYKTLAKTSNDPRHFIAYGVCLQRLIAYFGSCLIHRRSSS